MREELLLELENEYGQLRAENEREEVRRLEKIRTEQPEIYRLVQERRELVFGTMRKILDRNADTEGLPLKMEQLSAAIRTKLTENGFDADYLAPVYRCPICRDTGKAGDPVREPCVCFKKAYQRKLREKIGLGSEKTETFALFNLDIFPDEKIPGQNFTQRELMAHQKSICERWANEYPNAPFRDLVLTGNTGLGKTFLLRAMAEKLIERDIHVLLVNAYQMLEMLRKSYFDNSSDAAELMDAEVLMIDDLGSEPMMQNITVEQLFHLINERQNKNKSTVISSNLDMAKFRERYSERIASRLRDSRYCKVISLLGKDIRTGGNLKA